jgi:hypothetical protein
VSHEHVVLLATFGALVLIAWAWAFARKADHASGKAEAYREVAAHFSTLRDLSWMNDKKRQAAERMRGYFMLSMCDPDVREALREGLAQADEEWGPMQRREPA